MTSMFGKEIGWLLHLISRAISKRKNPKENPFILFFLFLGIAETGRGADLLISPPT